MPQPPGETTFELRLQLRDVEPEVWRRLLVPGTIRLGKLHDIFQAAMGWHNSHLHNFLIGDARYGSQFDDYPPEELNEQDVTVLRALADHSDFVYEYDFGDGWEHDFVVEARHTTPYSLKYAACLDGRGACRPEDCGGPPGYALMLEALEDPSHPEHDEFQKWLSGPFDPAAFDLVSANIGLQRLTR
jgi:Plasmid pRiA4b ORF-3-like protein